MQSYPNVNYLFAFSGDTTVNMTSVHTTGYTVYDIIVDDTVDGAVILAFDIGIGRMTSDGTITQLAGKTSRGYVWSMFLRHYMLSIFLFLTVSFIKRQ